MQNSDEQKWIRIHRSFLILYYWVVDSGSGGVVFICVCFCYELPNVSVVNLRRFVFIITPFLVVSVIFVAGALKPRVRIHKRMPVAYIKVQSVIRDGPLHLSGCPNYRYQRTCKAHWRKKHRNYQKQSNDTVIYVLHFSRIYPFPPCLFFQIKYLHW